MKFLNLKKKIEEMTRQINLLKLKQYAVQINYLVQQIIQAVADGNSDEQTHQHINRLDFVAHDTAHRLTDTDLGHISQLCDTLVTVTERIKTNLTSPNEKDIKLLPPLATAIAASFETDTDSAADFANLISSEVN